MLISHLKINQANLKKEIEENYLDIYDRFYRCLAVSLCIYDRSVEPILYNTVIEDEKYAYFLMEVSAAFDRGEDIVQAIHPEYNIAMFTDVNLYLSDFLKVKHNKKMMNIYCLTIDEKCNVVISIKSLGKHAH